MEQLEKKALKQIQMNDDKMKRRMNVNDECERIPTEVFGGRR